MLAAPGDGKQYLLIGYLALQMTQNYCWCIRHFFVISSSGTDEPEWMSPFSETLLQHYMGSCCYCHLGYNSSWCYKLLSHSVVFFLSIGKGLHRCKGVQYIFILWLNLSLTNFYTTTMYSCAIAKGDLGFANVTRTNPAFVHKVTVTQNGKWAWHRVWSEEHVVSY